MTNFTSLVYNYGFVNVVEDDRKVGRMVIENNGTFAVVDTIIWDQQWVFAVVGKGHFETTDIKVFEQFLVALSR